MTFPVRGDNFITLWKVKLVDPRTMQTCVECWEEFPQFANPNNDFVCQRCRKQLEKRK